MRIGFAQLAEVDHHLWTLAATAWRRLSDRVDGHADELGRCRDRVNHAWSGGTAAAVAERALDRTRQALDSCRAPLLEADQLLAEHAERIRGLRARLAAAVAATAGTAVRVTATGEVVVEVTGATRPRPEAVALAKRVSTELADVLRLARKADEETARRLTELAEAIGTGAAAAVPDPLPAGPPVGGPAQVARWWAGLSQEQRRWLVRQRSALIGGLDGVPADVRDRANRRLLDDEQRRLRAELDSLTGHAGAHTAVAAAGLRESLSGLRALTNRLDQPEPRAYLLGLRTGGDGQAILAFGNPDRGDNVATYVPGVGASVNRLAGELDRAATLQSRATALAADRSTSTVMWLGYDPPDFADAALTRSALDARTALRDFQAGLAVTHVGELGQQTVLGHSYGSLVVGLAERDGSVTADDIVALGSPGMGVDRAAELRDPAQVWAATARNDAIELAPSKGEAGVSLVLGPAALVVGAVSDAVTGLNADLWHGVDPTSAQFGGRVFASGLGTDPIDAHASYFDGDNPALQTMAEIVTGRR